MPDENEIKGIPDVDLTSIMGELEKNVQPQEEKPPEQQAPVVEKELDLAQFKTPKDLLKGYKEVQAAFTKMSQENKKYKEMEAQMKEMQEQMEIAKMQQNAPPMPVTGYAETDEEKLYRIASTQRIAETLEELAQTKEGKPDPEFRERYAYAKMVAEEYPHLARTAVGVKKLFDLGDKRRMETMRRVSFKALEPIFGGPLSEEQIAKLREIVKGSGTPQQQKQFNSNAYMPDTSTSTKSGMDQNRTPNIESDIDESVKKGDVDGVIASIFRKQLAE